MLLAVEDSDQPRSELPHADGESHEDAVRREIWREGFTMALYISLSQLAVMSALPTAHGEERLQLALTLLLTSVGLVLAHQIAFRLSSRLVQPGSTLEPMAPHLLRAQLLGGGAVTLVAVIPVVILGAAAYWLSMLLLLLFVLVVGYLVARSTPVSRTRALVYVLIVALVVLGVIAVKTLVSH
jgi:hypothetical protein